MPARPPADSLAVVEAEVVACRACPRLVAWREQVGREKRAAFQDEEYWAKPVPGFGDPAARLLIVGLAPAAHGANRTGRMFTGDRSGDFLYAALHRAPPANQPTIGERDQCTPFLRRELALLVDVRVVMVLGAFAYQVMAGMLGLKGRPKFAHGAEATLPDGRTLLCSYHVSQQNTFTGTLTPAMLDAVLGRAKAISA